MAEISWRLKGIDYGNCNCAYGCPCQFDDAVGQHQYLVADLSRAEGRG